MKYLAFDSSGSELVVCAKNEDKYYEKRLVASGTEHIMVLIDSVLKKLKMDISSLEYLGVGVGPGSWTGSRVSVVTAYGLCAGNEKIKVVPFNYFEMLSYNDIEKDKKLYLKKAYANFVYASVAGGDPIILTQAELKEKYGNFVWVSDEKLFGNEVIQEKKIREMIEGKIKEGKVKNIKEVEPIYLRLSQAEYQYMEKHKGDK